MGICTKRLGVKIYLEFHGKFFGIFFIFYIFYEKVSAKIPRHVRQIVFQTHLSERVSKSAVDALENFSHSYTFPLTGD